MVVAAATSSSRQDAAGQQLMRLVPRALPRLRSGEAWIKNQGYPGYLDRGKCVIVLFFYIIGYRLIAFLGVRFIKY